MTMGGKAPTFPIYTVVDADRPAPNFMVDRTSNPYVWSALVFSTSEKAVDFAKHMMFTDEKLNMSFSVITSEKEFRGILIAITELCDKIKWVHLDPSDSRRTPKRWLVKDLIDTPSRKG